MKYEERLLTNLLQKHAGYVHLLQAKHWNATDISEHELLQDVYEDFRDTLDEIGEEIRYNQLSGYFPNTGVELPIGDHNFAEHVTDDLMNLINYLEDALDSGKISKLAVEDFIIEVLRGYQEAYYLLKSNGTM